MLMEPSHIEQKLKPSSMPNAVAAPKAQSQISPAAAGRTPPMNQKRRPVRSIRKAQSSEPITAAGRRCRWRS